MIKKNKQFNDFDTLVESIRDHNIKHNVVTILCDDKPAKLRIGFKCIESGQRWEMSIVQLRKWKDNLPPDEIGKLKIDFISKTLPVSEEKIQLAVFLSNLR
jgi:hypothetical protein